MVMPPRGLVIVACALTLAACSKSDAPKAPAAVAPPSTAVAAPNPSAPAPPAGAAPSAAGTAPGALASVAPPANRTNEALKRAVAEAYVFGYPLVLMDVARELDAARTPINTFEHERRAADGAPPTAAFANDDVLYSRAWLDLSKEPVVLSLPEARDRYYAVPLIDGWTNVFTTLGKRTTGGDKRDFAIVGPHHKGAIPDALTVIQAPTDLVWAVGRIEASGKGDAAAAAKFQERLTALTLSQWNKHAAAKRMTVATRDDKGAPAERVAAMEPAQFFTRLAQLLPHNPPAKEDAPMMAKLATIGLVPGKPFDVAARDADAQAALRDGVKAARDALVTGAHGDLGELRNGWSIQYDTGRYGISYGLRAVVAATSLGANAPEDAIFAVAQFDGQGRRLNGANRYALHFDAGKLPPVDAFWALSMYDAKQHFVANPLHRYARGSEDGLAFNPDGSLDVYLQRDTPGAGKEANWLPAPAGDFYVMLRLYWPKQDVLDRRWFPPGIRAVP